MPKAYSYIRMSTEQQAKRGESLRRQLSLSKAYAAKRGFDFQDIEFQDLGVSAFKAKNVKDGALGRLIHAVRDGKIESGSFLIVESLDRISRGDALSALSPLLELLAAGITIVTLADQQEYSQASLKSSAGYFQLGGSLQVLHRAHDESLTRSLRITAAWDQKRLVLKDKRLTRTCPYWLKPSDGGSGFELVPERASVVTDIFEWSRDGQGVVAIARRLNQRQVPSWRKAETGWHISYIKKILQNRAVLGEFTAYVTKSGNRVPVETVQDYYPRVVSDSLFAAVRAGIDSRKNKGGRKGVAHTNLFSALVYCHYCGESVRVVDKGKGPKGGKWLRCSGAIRGRCTAKGWPLNHFEQCFLHVVSEIDLAALFANEETKSRLNEWSNRRALLASQLVEAEAKLEGAAEAITKLRGSAQDALAQAMNATNDEIAMVEAELKSADEQAAILSSRVNSSVSRAEQVSLLIKQLTERGPELADRRTRLAQLLRESVTRIVLRAGLRVQPPNDGEAQLREAFGDDNVDAHIAAMNVVRAKQSRIFQAFFPDGTQRTVLASDNGDPTRYEVTLSDRGGWKAQFGGDLERDESDACS